MAIRNGIYTFILFVLYLCHCNAVREGCPCDLTLDGCDANCCCDFDCDRKDINFTFVCTQDSQLTTLDDRLCVKKTVVFNLANSQYEFNETDEGGGLFCIYFDNYEKRNYYIDVDPIKTPETLQYYIGNYSTFTFQRPSYTRLNFTKFYKSGDPVYIVYPDILGRLRAPRGVNSQSCSRQTPVAYLESRTSTCTEHIKDLELACNNISVINSDLYWKGFTVLKTPSPLTALNQNGTTGEIDISNIAGLDKLYADTDYAVAPTLGDVMCRRPNGLVEACQYALVHPPVYNASNAMCRNAVVKVAYTIDHKGVDGITKLTAHFTFADITKSDLPLSQTFSTEFVRETKKTPIKLSGNPGYVVGQPIIMGIKDGDNVRFNNDSRRDWLVLIKPSSNQKCVLSPSNSFTVNFGEDIRTGCLIESSQENLRSDCVKLHQTLDNLFGYTDLDNALVAVYGNSSTDLKEWLPVIKINEPDTSQTCESFTLGINYRFLYAKTGSLVNPQPRIVGAAVEYDSKQKLQFRCTGSFCMPNDTKKQHFEVIQTVSFIDVSRPATQVTGEPPIFYAKLPRDFFFPFLYSSSLCLSVSSTSALLVVVVVVVSILFTY